MDITKTTTEITLLRRALKTAPTVSIKVKIKSKIARLKQYIEDSSVPTAKLAKLLLGSKRKVLAYSTQEFNDAIGRLSMKGEYSFLKGMGKGKIKDDLKREAKPVGYRFVGRDNFKKPTRQEIIDGRKNGTVYMENRANRSDVVRPAKLEYGGVITQEQYDEITTEHKPFAVKSGSSIHDVINSTIALNLACKKRDVSVQDYKNYGKFAKGGAMEHGLKKGDTIKDDLFWEDSVVVNNSKTGIAKVDLDKGTRTQMAKGGGIEKQGNSFIKTKTTYIPNRDIKTLSLILKGELKTLKGSDIVDGVYVKNVKEKSLAAKGWNVDAIYKSLLNDVDNKLGSDYAEFKANIKHADIKRLVDVGYTKSQIETIYFGYRYNNTMNGDVEMGEISGLTNYNDDAIDRAITRFVDCQKEKAFEIGLKYPSFNWGAIIKKHSISATPRIIKFKRSWGSTAEYDYNIYEVFIGKNVVVGHQIGRERYKNGKLFETIMDGNEVKNPLNVNKYQKERDYQAGFNGGYWGVVSSKIETVEDIAKMLSSQDDSYVKDFDMYVNTLGGVGADELNENKIKYAEGGSLEFVGMNSEMSKYELEMLQGKSANKGVSIEQMNTILSERFPYSFGFSLNDAKSPEDLRYLKPNQDNPLRGIKDSGVKISFNPYHGMDFRVFQGGENTYFYFLLYGSDDKEYIGEFGFKDKGDVPKEYVTSFISFLCTMYGFPYKVSHNVYSKGGGIGQENKEMVLNNNKQIAHHTKEMSMAVKNAKNVPAWVVAKVNRSASDLSDATHYMDGQGESYANGGQVGSGSNGYIAFYKGKRIEVYADTIYQAQQVAAKHFKAKKAWEVNVGLAEVNGKQYIQSTAFAKGGGVANSTTNVTNDMRGEDSDDYGTFEIYKNGGEIKVSVVNSNKRYNENAYNWILGDFDKDGVPNADDTKPLDKNKTKRIDEPSITSGIKSLISLKNTLDSKMYSFINELKDIAPNKSKIYARTKTPYSVLDKLIKKRLSTITDLIGTTVVTNDKNELDTVKKYVQSGEMGKVIEFEDMYKSPKKGYRAYHFLIDRDGMSIELQLKTKRQKALNELTHEPYKLGNINVPLQLKMTEVANRADEGDKDAIKEYNEFMKQPNIEKVFYAKSGDKMAKGATITTDVKAILDAKRAKIKSRKSKR